jgi:hypothetical protein
LEQLSVGELVEAARSRLEEFKGAGDMRRLTISVDDHAGCRMICNRHSLSFVFESLFRTILDGDAGQFHLRFVVWPGPNSDYARVHIQVDQGQPFDEASLSFIADLLSTYGISVLFDPQKKSPSFEMKIPREPVKVVEAIQRQAS